MYSKIICLSFFAFCHQVGAPFAGDLRSNHVEHRVEYTERFLELLEGPEGEELIREVLSEASHAIHDHFNQLTEILDKALHVLWSIEQIHFCHGGAQVPHFAQMFYDLVRSGADLSKLVQFAGDDALFFWVLELYQTDDLEKGTN